MNRQPFNHRSSQVLAVFRVMMAALFGVWVWFYLGQPVLGGELTYLIITAYVFYAMGMFAVARFDWWLDHRLALPAFVIDVCAYLAALHITQAAITAIQRRYQIACNLRDKSSRNASIHYRSQSARQRAVHSEAVSQKAVIRSKIAG